MPKAPGDSRRDPQHGAVPAAPPRAAPPDGSQQRRLPGAAAPSPLPSPIPSVSPVPVRSPRTAVLSPAPCPRHVPQPPGAPRGRAGPGPSAPLLRSPPLPRRRRRLENSSAAGRAGATPRQPIRAALAGGVANGSGGKQGAGRGAAYQGAAPGLSR